MSTDRLLIRVPSSRISDRSQANKPMINTAKAKEVKSTVLTMMMSSVFTVSAVLQFPGILAGGIENGRFAWFRKNPRPRFAF